MYILEYNSVVPDPIHPTVCEPGWAFESSAQANILFPPFFTVIFSATQILPLKQAIPEESIITLKVSDVENPKL
jgi:hypothetical protein